MATQTPDLHGDPINNEPEVTDVVDDVPVEREAQVGDQVLYVLPTGLSQGQIRPAVIVRVWEPDFVNLQVFTDGNNDHPHEAPLWAGSVYRNDDAVPGTWHYKR